ncbi:unnamed protein product [Prunus armeniaca]
MTNLYITTVSFYHRLHSLLRRFFKESSFGVKYHSGLYGLLTTDFSKLDLPPPLLALCQYAETKLEALNKTMGIKMPGEVFGWAFFFWQLQIGWAAVKRKFLKLPHVSEFQNKAPKALRKGSRALGSVDFSKLDLPPPLLALCQYAETKLEALNKTMGIKMPGEVFGCEHDTYILHEDILPFFPPLFYAQV